MYQQGYFVKVTGNRQQMVDLQVGHGEWVDSMDQVSVSTGVMLVHQSRCSNWAWRGWWGGGGRVFCSICYFITSKYVLLFKD